MVNFVRNLRQIATYWAPGQEDLYGGMTFSEPVPLICRWEDKAELIRSKRGQEITSKSKVFLAQDVDLDGYLYFGVSSAVDPRTIDGANEINQVMRIPDLRALKTLFVVYL